MKIHCVLKTIIHCWKLERLEHWKICQKHPLDPIQEAICCEKKKLLLFHRMENLALAKARTKGMFYFPILFRQLLNLILDTSWRFFCSVFNHGILAHSNTIWNKKNETPKVVHWADLLFGGCELQCLNIEPSVLFWECMYRVWIYFVFGCTCDTTPQ